jgi:hypothetical protein
MTPLKFVPFVLGSMRRYLWISGSSLHSKKHRQLSVYRVYRVYRRLPAEAKPISQCCRSIPLDQAAALS